MVKQVEKLSTFGTYIHKSGSNNQIAERNRFEGGLHCMFAVNRTMCGSTCNAIQDEHADANYGKTTAIGVEWAGGP